MAGVILAACRRAYVIFNSAAEMLRIQHVRGWSDIELIQFNLRLVQRGFVCPSLEQFLQFLSTVDNVHSQQFFVAVKDLMETMTNLGLPFAEIMELYVRMDDRLKIRASNPPPTIPGFLAPTLSLDLWRLLKRLYFFQSSLRPVTLRSVISLHNKMMISSSRSEQYGFVFRCVMHRMNPRCQLVMLSPGMIRKFLFRFLRSKYGSVNYTVLKNF